jgi:hypothetical protein
MAERKQQFLDHINTLNDDEMKDLFSSMSTEQLGVAKEWMGEVKAESAAAGPAPSTMQRGPSTAEKVRQSTFRIPQLAGELAGEAAGFTPVAKGATGAVKAGQYALGRGGSVGAAGLGGGAGRAIGEAQMGMIDEGEGLQQSLQRVSHMATNLSFLGPLAGPAAGMIEYFAEQAEEEGGGDVSYDPRQTETMGEAFETGSEEGMIGAALGHGVADPLLRGASKTAKYLPSKSSEAMGAAGRLADGPIEELKPFGAEMAGRMSPAQKLRAPEGSMEGAASAMISGTAEFGPLSKRVLGGQMNRVAKAAEDTYEVLLNRISTMELPPAEAANQVIAGHRELKDSMRKPLSQAYDFLVQNNPTTPIQFENLRAAMKEDSLLSQMAGLDALLGAGAPLQGQGNNSLRLLVQKANNLQDSLPYPEAKALLDGLRQALREAKNKGDWKPIKVGISKIEEAMDQDLHESLVKYAQSLPEGFEIGGVPFDADGTSNMLRFLDNEYRTFKKRFDVKVIKDLVDADAPEAVLPKLFNKDNESITQAVRDTMDTASWNKSVRSWFEKTAKDAKFRRDPELRSTKKGPEMEADDSALADAWFNRLSDKQRNLMIPDAEHRQVMTDLMTVLRGARPHEEARRLSGSGLDLMEKTRAASAFGGVAGIGTAAVAGGMAGGPVGAAGASLVAILGPAAFARMATSKRLTSAAFTAARMVERIERNAPISAVQMTQIAHRFWKEADELENASPVSSIPDVTVRPPGAEDDSEVVPDFSPEEAPVLP